MNHIRIFAFCIMDTHYHLVLENTSGRLSPFLKQVNGQYAMHFRKTSGGSGYVFQNRFHSTLIQDESYLIQAIAYVLLNPLRARTVKQPRDYVWSSARIPFNEVEKGRIPWLDAEFVENLFGSSPEFDRVLSESIDFDPPIMKTRLGPIWGGDDLNADRIGKFERRELPDPVKRKRIDDRFFEPVNKVIQEFETRHAIKVERVSTDTHSGKRLRAELLVLLKDHSGMKYSEIAELELFSDLQASSLGRLYQNAKRRMR